jgi:hypothetical protein
VYFLFSEFCIISRQLVINSVNVNCFTIWKRPTLASCILCCHNQYSQFVSQLNTIITHWGEALRYYNVMLCVSSSTFWAIVWGVSRSDCTEYTVILWLLCVGRPGEVSKKSLLWLRTKAAQYVLHPAECHQQHCKHHSDSGQQVSSLLDIVQEVIAVCWLKVIALKIIRRIGLSVGQITKYKCVRWLCASCWRS